MRHTTTYVIAALLFCYNNQLVAQTSASLPSRYAVVVGISDYKNPKLRLNYAADDAKQFYNSLLDYGRFKKEDIQLLTDADATRENIRKGIEGWLQKIAQEQDVVLIYFSGHGTQIQDSDGDEDDGLDECLVPSDADLDDNSSFINDDQFAYWVRNLRSAKVLIIFDNCFSGGAAKGKGILMPGMKGGKVLDDFSQDLTREIPRQGTALLAASKSEQISFESDEFKNGLFTHFLLESVSASADNNFDGIIDAEELFYYVRPKTLDYSKQKWNREQEPVFINTIKDEIDIFYLPVKKGDASPSKKIEELQYRAQNENDYAKKIELLIEALKLDPANVHVNSLLATWYEQTGRLEEAAFRYRYLMSLGLKRWSFSPPLPARLGTIYEKMGRMSDALSWYMKGLKERPTDPDLCKSIGNLYLSQGDTVSSLQYFNRSIDTQPLQKDTYFDLFYIHLAQNSFETGYKIMKRCYEINPNDFQAIYWMGMLEKYLMSHVAFGDSLLRVFETNSGIKRYKEEIVSNKSRFIYSVDGKLLKGVELQRYLIKNAISAYPYYADFYKAYVLFALENKSVEECRINGDEYIKYSKLNPDSDFIARLLE